jgi:membrane protein DedA with SNARE-associated domain
VDLSTPASILSFLQGQGYLIIFLVMCLEGPLITYVAAFAASLGVFNIVVIYLLSLAGNLTGDIIYYTIGKFASASFVRRRSLKTMSGWRMERVSAYLRKNPGKALTIIKLTPPLPTPGLILAGASGIPLRTFLLYSLVVSTCYSLVFTLAGFYSGVAFGVVASYVNYLPVLFGVAVALFVAVWFVLKSLSRRLSRRIERNERD